MDTTRAAVAPRRWTPGRGMVNDVSGGLADPEMAAVVADAGVPWILMHWRGHSADMDALAALRRRGGRGAGASCWPGSTAAVAAGVDESA